MFGDRGQAAAHESALRIIRFEVLYLKYYVQIVSAFPEGPYLQKKLRQS